MQVYWDAANEQSHIFHCYADADRKRIKRFVREKKWWNTFL